MIPITLTQFVFLILGLLAAAIVIALLWFLINYIESQFPAPFVYRIIRIVFVVLIVVFAIFAILSFVTGKSIFVDPDVNRRLQ